MDAAPEMYHCYHRITYLTLLYEQHRYYTELLGDSHRALGRQYKRLAELELALAQRHETHMPRREKKYLQWSRAKVKKSIRDIERQQEYLHEYLRQCGDLIHSHAGGASAWRDRGRSPVVQPPYPVTPIDPHWPAFDDIDQCPKYWDLSMLREREASTASIPSADSGFYEPSTYDQFERRDSTRTSTELSATSPVFQPRQNSFQFETDAFEDLGSSASPTKEGAKLPTVTRRYFEDAGRSIHNRLASSMTHSRARSANQLFVLQREAP